jgi:hypothetical protein
MRRPLLVLGVILLSVAPAFAQHEHHDQAPPPSGWHFMQDGVVFLTFNHQGGPIGETELTSQNWWMGMFGRQVGPGRLTLASMFSLEPITERGYSHLFQVGETWEGRPIVDRQHPHEFLMQLSAVWKIPIGSRTSVVLAGAPVGEPALGPVAFMHRRSAAENPSSPIGHHTFDATHIAMGVITGGFEHGPWFVEASTFHGREPDENRWDLADLGPLDSWSARIWFRPDEHWTFQLSRGWLNEPEALVAGDLNRTTASIAWESERADGFTAVTAAYGRNDGHHGQSDAFLLEGTHRLGKYAGYSRFEVTEVETDVLRFGVYPLPHVHDGFEPPHAVAHDPVIAWTLGATRDVWRWAGLDFAAGGDVTIYGVPDSLVPTHSAHPVSFHVFLRTRLPAPAGRMWNATMTRPAH